MVQPRSRCSSVVFSSALCSFFSDWPFVQGQGETRVLRSSRHDKPVHLTVCTILSICGVPLGSSRHTSLSLRKPGSIASQAVS